MPDFAANLSTMFTELPFLERFGAAARCGFDAVEVAFPYGVPKEQVAARLREHGLALVAINLPVGTEKEGERGIACDPERTAEFRDGVRRATDYAAAVNCRLLNCLVGARPSGATDAMIQATLVDNLRFAAQQALANSATILVEAVDTASLPGSHLRATAQAVALLDAVGARNVSLLFDVCHMHAMGETAAAMIARHRARIGHIQIAGYPDRCEPVGGEIDYDELLGFLDGIGYRGWVGCEYRPLADTETGLGWMMRHKVLTPRMPHRWGIPLHALRQSDSVGGVARRGLSDS
ncbi:MAG: hydroxypyruvate isomerase [Rhodospirillales bacterium]|nr:hydroxypyruvate isomerase [Rhodospirillales bacterium]